MPTDFERTLKPILTVAKLCGFINFVYVLEPNGLLARDTSTIYYSFLEILRMIVLLICAYKNFNNEFRIPQILIACKFWFVIIAARLSEIWIVKFINGITEYDRKLTLLPKIWTEQHQQCMSKTYWNAFLVVLFAYYVLFQIYYTYLWPPKNIDFSILTIILFQPPFIIDFAVIILLCFYIVNLDRRFHMLNCVWQRLPTGLVAVPGSYTYSEIAVLVENMRLLHAEMCELLRIFSLGFGQVLLAYFAISYVNMVFQFFLMISLKFAKPRFNPTENIFRSLLPYVLNLQHIVFVVFIIVAASRIIEKKKKMISYLRLNKITDLPVDLKLQVKQFMNQILIYESDEMTAFGFFNIDLNLVVTILVLLITGLSTLIQMKEHPFILFLVNDTLLYVANLIENTNGEDLAQNSRNTNKTIV